MVESLWNFLQTTYIWFFGEKLANDSFIKIFTDVFSVLFLFTMLYCLLFYPCTIILKTFIDYFKLGAKNNEINR